MSYLEEMKLQIENQNFPCFMQLWDEYKTSTEIEAQELIGILGAVKESEYKVLFGRHAEEVLTLVEYLDKPELKGEVLKFILDLQTSQSEEMANIALDYLESTYGDTPALKEKLRVVGLRSLDDFQGAIRNFELLVHMSKGRFIFHKGDWGAGEIMDISLIREQVAIEFENVVGIRELSFKNAFNNLIPISNDHFLARRYGNPDDLEEQANKDPVSVVKLLLSDLGPKTAAQIKEEMFELVINPDNWSKWWQAARSKCKKDTKVQSPKTLSQNFVLLDKDISYTDKFSKIIADDNLDVEEFLDKTYKFSKQHPEVLKNKELKAEFREKLLNILNGLTENQELLKIQIYIYIEEFFNDHLDQALSKIIKDAVDIEFIIRALPISSMKKKVLALCKKYRDDWKEHFTSIFLSIPYHFIRDYALKELTSAKEDELINKMLQKLLDHPVMYPECFVWYFQKIQLSSDLAMSDKAGKEVFFETLFILLYHIENNPEKVELSKRVQSMVVSKHYQLYRDNIAGTSIEYAREILLLVSKCQSFTNHDLKGIQALTKVVHKGLEGVKEDSQKEHIIWTTVEGYQKVQERIHHIATVETVDNAKEIEVARAHGDLRENAEFKSAQERRARLQSEMKLLSTQLSQARILSPEDISTESVGVGAVVDLVNKDGSEVKYKILGPWDADPDKGILSFQSRLASSMTGKKVNESFSFKSQDYTVKDIKSYLG